MATTATLVRPVCAFLFAPLVTLFIFVPQVNSRVSEVGDTSGEFGIMTTTYDFEGTVSMSGCSGSLVRIAGAADSEKGLILTAGHCIESDNPVPGKHIYHQPNSRVFDLLGPAAGTVGQLHATEILYSTMTNTDLTLYRLRESYLDIKQKFGVRAFELSPSRPQLGAIIDVISGYWSEGYRCSIEAFIPGLKEEQWTFHDAIRYSQPGCQIIWATSGSPVVIKGTRNIVGVNTTINVSGLSCQYDNPCEIDSSGGMSIHQGSGYAQQTYWIYSCIDATGGFDLATTGCLLIH